LRFAFLYNYFTGIITLVIIVEFTLRNRRVTHLYLQIHWAAQLQRVLLVSDQQWKRDLQLIFIPSASLAANLLWETRVRKAREFNPAVPHKPICLYSYSQSKWGELC
jgi:hypothetical protein